MSEPKLTDGQLIKKIYELLDATPVFDAKLDPAEEAVRLDKAIQDVHYMIDVWMSEP